MNILLLAVLLIIIFIILMYFNVIDTSKGKDTFSLIMEDFKNVRVYHNIEPDIIAKKYGIKQTQFSENIPSQEKYELGFVSKRETAKYQQEIPYYIFQTWKTSILEKPLFNNTKKWFLLNPEYNYFLFNDTHVENLIRIEYGERILNLYKNLLVGASKADVWRLMVIYCYGGIYFDLDCEMKEEYPFRVWGFGNREVVTGKGSDGAPHQWGLIYKPGHPIIKKAIQRVLFELYHQHSTRLLQIAYYPYVVSFLETPMFTEGWKDYMDGKVVFCNSDNKKVMLSYESHWQTKTCFYKNKMIKNK